MLSRNFCQKCMSVNFRNFHTVNNIVCIANQQKITSNFFWVRYQQMHHAWSKCEKSTIFLALRFYVKSILMNWFHIKCDWHYQLASLESQSLPFQQIERIWILILMNVCTSWWRLKLTKSRKFRAASKWQKQQF